MHKLKSLPNVLLPALVLGLLLFGCAPEERRRQTETPPAAVTTETPEVSPTPAGPPDPPPTEPAPSEPSPAGGGEGTEGGETAEGEGAEAELPDEDVMEEADVIITLTNEASQAWLVESVEGGEDVAATGEENPTITLEVGQRYLFVNARSGLHPLAFRDQDGSILLTQEGGGQGGTFALDGQVDQVVEGDTLAFTLTPELANAINTYICAVHHNSMVGNVEVVGQ
jgi:plastocyanin